MKAKLYKFTGYFVDANDEYTANDIAIIIGNELDMMYDNIEVQEVDIGEWYDEHILNRCDCPKEEYEKYFTN